MKSHAMRHGYVCNSAATSSVQMLELDSSEAICIFFGVEIR